MRTLRGGLRIGNEDSYVVLLREPARERMGERELLVPAKEDDDHAFRLLVRLLPPVVPAALLVRLEKARAAACFSPEESAQLALGPDYAPLESLAAPVPLSVGCFDWKTERRDPSSHPEGEGESDLERYVRAKPVAERGEPGRLEEEGGRRCMQRGRPVEVLRRSVGEVASGGGGRGEGEDESARGEESAAVLLCPRSAEERLRVRGGEGLDVRVDEDELVGRDASCGEDDGERWRAVGGVGKKVDGGAKRF